jgi:hypothetical protein
VQVVRRRSPVFLFPKLSGLRTVTDMSEQQRIVVAWGNIFYLLAEAVKPYSLVTFASMSATSTFSMSTAPVTIR